ncbi:MAG TPA: nucleoside triphosphate pyrophosphohydrolase [Dehalococcoidia bacterium]|nr:nucleoside triphosphate pyrophosphohydrolase [Dehalococcoidia bacterium]
MELTAFGSACRAFGIGSLGAGLHLAFGSAPSFDPAVASLLLDVRRDDMAQLCRSLRQRYPATHSVRILDEDGVREVDLAHLETAMDGEQASVLVPPLAAEDDVRDFRGLVAIIRRLRDPEPGCPWDRQQTHASLKRYLLEEAYETLDALDRDDAAALREELGDLLLQIVLHARIAEQSDEFETADVVEAISAKLIRRHPHVFGDVTAHTARDVEQRWDELKRAESADGSSTSALGGVPRAMPALAYSQAILGRAERAGFAWPGTDDVLAKVAEEARELAGARDVDERREEFGDLLFALVSLARRLDVDAEESLRLAATKFRSRFEALESMAREERVSLASLDPKPLLALWERAKEQAAEA